MTRALVPALALAAGCGFELRGTALGDAGAGDGSAIGDAEGPDVAIDSAPVTCLEHWHAHQVSFTTPVLVPGAPTNGDQGDPFLDPAETTMWFVWNGGIGGNDDDIYAAMRADTASAFMTAQISSLADTVFNDSKASITDDGLTAVFASSRPSGEGGWDLWKAQRAVTTSPFGSATQLGLDAVNTSGDQLDPHLSAAGERLYFATGTPQQVMVATRTIAGAYDPPVALSINGSNGDADPTLSGDETVIVFSSNRSTNGGPTGSNLWYATRSSLGDAFSTPQVLPVVNGNTSDGDGFLSRDGCRLYFASNRAGSWDLYVSTLVL